MDLPAVHPGRLHLLHRDLAGDRALAPLPAARVEREEGCPAGLAMTPLDLADVIGPAVQRGFALGRDGRRDQQRRGHRRDPAARKHEPFTRHEIDHRAGEDRDEVGDDGVQAGGGQDRRDRDIAHERHEAVDRMEADEPGGDLAGTSGGAIPPGPGLVPHEVVDQGRLDRHDGAECHGQSRPGGQHAQDRQLNRHPSHPDQVERHPSRRI
jgi:hypothetical protein